MVEPNIYCKVSGMAVEAIHRLNTEENRLPIVIEIGCADGQGTMRYAGLCKKVIAIDAMVQGRPDIISDQKEHMNLDEAKLNDFQRRVSDFPVELVIGSSTWDETVSKVQELLGNEKADLLIVDGCHHPFEAVWKDFELYSPMVKTGGYVIFDDLYEECIELAYKKCISELSYLEIDRWSIRNERILQDVGLLRKLL